MLNKIKKNGICSKETQANAVFNLKCKIRTNEGGSGVKMNKKVVKKIASLCTLIWKPVL